jgi:tRNA modification GTPase
VKPRGVRREDPPPTLAAFASADLLMVSVESRSVGRTSVMRLDPPSPPPRVAVLTPEGRGAISVVRVWGPRALEVADSAFRPVRGERLARTDPGRPRVGRMGVGLGDDVVAVVVEGDPPEVEIQCHGGPSPVALVVEALVAAGAERRQPVAWIRHVARSRIAAEAEVDLARAPTVRSAEVLLDQSQGALEADARRLIALARDDPSATLDEVEALLRRARVGLRLVSGWRVVLAGRPNVGKSRLLNGLAGFDRALVDPTPGTTRDVVAVRTAFDGWPVELADTAGLRTSEDAIEATGIARARTRQAEADLVVVVLDRSEPLTHADREVIEAFSGGLIVANKADLPPSWEPWAPQVLSISAQRGDGIEALAVAVAHRLVPEPQPPGAGVPFRSAHVRWLYEARDALNAGAVDAATRRLSEFLAHLPDPSRAHHGHRSAGEDDSD